MNRKTILVLAAFTAVACSKKKDQALTIPVELVKRETIVVNAEATGVVEPINVIEVKAKSSGQIVAMPVETGTFVKPGDLLVQLDTRDTRNSYAQAKADLDAAVIKQRVSKTARDRASQLFKERIITSAENEASEVDYANAQATVLRNRAALDLRQQGLDEATVRAPVGGTVIEKDVSLGQVIASGTGSFGAGTTILKMADLTKVRVRALVNETDIGKVRSGLPASVTVDAYPDRPFQGIVEKIEPQATIQQSVTMFPVLISIDNRGGLLMPGMNGEVSIETDHRENVLSVSNEAIRSPNEVTSVATLLALNPDSVRAQLASMGGGGNGRGGNGGATGGGKGGAVQTVANASTRAGNGTNGGTNGGQARARRGLVFTVKAGKYTPKVVRLGASNFDVSEVLSGLNEGDSVAILNVAVLQAQQQADMNQVRNRAGVPGMQRQQPTGGAGAGAGGAARPGGGGGAPRGGN